MLTILSLIIENYFFTTLVSELAAAVIMKINENF